MTTVQNLRELRERGDIVWENRRYGSAYAVDRPELVRRLAQHTPLIHVGQIDAIGAVRTATPGAHWLIAYLWCPRDVAQQRLVTRGANDLDARLRAWDETEPLPHAQVAINTAEMAAKEAARVIHTRLSMTHGLEPHPGRA